jgi:hypothetical protein
MNFFPYMSLCLTATRQDCKTNSPFGGYTARPHTAPSGAGIHGWPAGSRRPHLQFTAATTRALLAIQQTRPNSIEIPTPHTNGLRVTGFPTAGVLSEGGASVPQCSVGWASAVQRIPNATFSGARKIRSWPGRRCCLHEETKCPIRRQFTW